MKKKEIIIFAIILVIAIAAFLVVKFAGANDEKRVYITVDGEEYKSILLNDETEMSFTIYTEGGRNDVVIRNGHVDVVSADCPTQICVDTKHASEINDIIVCLPHKVVIEIIRNEEEIDYE